MAAFISIDQHTAASATATAILNAGKDLAVSVFAKSCGVNTDLDIINHFNTLINMIPSDLRQQIMKPVTPQSVSNTPSNPAPVTPQSVSNTLSILPEKVRELLAKEKAPNVAECVRLNAASQKILDEVTAQLGLPDYYAYIKTLSEENPRAAYVEYNKAKRAVLVKAMVYTSEIESDFKLRLSPLREYNDVDERLDAVRNRIHAIKGEVYGMKSTIIPTINGNIKKISPENFLVIRPIATNLCDEVADYRAHLVAIEELAYKKI